MLGWGLLLLACAEGPHPATAAGSTVTTDEGRYRITWSASPDPIPLAQLFEVHATVLDAASGAPVENATVTVDARMPAHGHGMQTRPETDPGTCVGTACTHPGGVYVARGMKFHMQGDWVIRIAVDGSAGTDHADVALAL